jgi:hypothetical protein
MQATNTDHGVTPWDSTSAPHVFCHISGKRCSRGTLSRIDNPGCQISSHMTGSEARRATERLVRICFSEASDGASLGRIEFIFPVEEALDFSTSENVRKNSLRQDEETQAHQATTDTIATPNTKVKGCNT